MLVELHPLKIASEQTINDNLHTELVFSERAKQRILELYNVTFVDYPASLQGGTIKITNNQGQSAYLPFTWFGRIKHCRVLIEALKEYSSHAEQLKTVIDDSVMRSLPKIDWQSSLDPADVTSIESFISSNFTEETDRANFTAFLDGRSWLNTKQDSNGSTVLSGKKLNRQSSDYIASCITTICKLINDTAGKLEHFIKIYIENDEVRNIIDNQNIALNPVITSHPVVGFNKIFYGAPGTGKSYRIKNEIGAAACIRTVFHPDTQYADFVGSLKPKTSVSPAGDQIITYEFRPGPFTRAFIEACRRGDTGEPVYLVIEEINRASAAAVFGELFQLLDRKADGSSEYSIDVSDPDMQAYIQNQLKNPLSTISLPNNLFLLATMNSSDQAVKPMDTAFKRRWSFEYIQIDYNKATPGQIQLPLRSGTTSIEWSVFAEKINNRLKSLQIPEDRLLGHRFLSDSELASPEAAINTVCGKLFVYLWDDVLRHGRRDIIFKTAQFGTFGELVNGYKNNFPVFCEELEEDLGSAPITEADVTVSNSSY